MFPWPLQFRAESIQVKCLASSKKCTITWSHKEVSKTKTKTSLYSCAAPSLPIVELPSCSLSVAYVNNSKALVATYCESVLAGKSGGKHIGNDVKGTRRFHFLNSDLVGNMYKKFIFV